MGVEGSKQSLVVMTNGDVYYISEASADFLEQRLIRQEPILKTRDVKSGAVLTIHVPNVSSIVREADRG